MRKSDIKEIKELFRSSEYISRINGNPFEAGKKLSSFKTAAFYAGFLNIVLDARRMAVKGQYSREELIRSSFQVIHNLEKLGAQFEVKGLDNLRKDSEPVVIAGNHMSTLETTAFPCIVGTSRDCTFVVKRSLVTNPVFGPVMRSLDPIDVERKDPRRDLDSVLTKGVELLEKGISVILFPQATRKAGFDPETFNSLGVKLAKRAGVKIIPAALKTDLWENGKKISTCGYIYPGRRVYIEFGEPLSIDGAGKKQQEMIVSFISGRIADWQ